MTEISSCATAAAVLYEALFESNGFNIAVVENDDIDFSSGSEDIGRVHASVSVPAHDLTISPRRRRVEPGGRIKFCIEPRVRQGADPFAAAPMIGESHGDTFVFCYDLRRLC
jgi:hypothetical protein